MEDFFVYKDGALYWSAYPGGSVVVGSRFGCKTKDTLRGTFKGAKKHVGEWVFKYFNGEFPKKLLFKDGNQFNCNIDNLVDMTSAKRGSKDWCNFFFTYESGRVYWKIGMKGVTPMTEVGTTNTKGYRIVLVNGKHSLVHRIVWIMHNEEIPSGYVIDHINGDKLDNRICNLRLATSQQNSRNRAGVKGVCRVTRTGKWQAAIQVGGRSVHLGTFDSEEKAVAKRIEAESFIFKEFSPRAL